jgi:subtilase family serine protease
MPVAIEARRRRRRAAALAAAALAGVLVLALALLAGVAGAAPRRPGGVISDTPSSTRPHWACPEGLCDAIVDPRPSAGAAPFAQTDPAHKPEGSGEEGGYDPQDLRSAYAIPTTGGAGQTIAVIEGFAYKKAEMDLAEYRARYGLPPCTSSDGCFTAVNGKGATPHYGGVSEWETEEALDLDMASTACQECHILLVDAEGESWDALAKAVDMAASLGATEISNSYGLPEETCEAECVEAASGYDHPGVMVFVSSGDYGYDNYLEGAASPSYPADQPDVIAVGGTRLNHASGARGWSEKVWGEPKLGVGSGSGCTLESKPSWQTDTGCSGRADNDVAAVGACSTPVSVYNSREGGWLNICGTSVSSPLMAGIEAHASEYARSLPGAEAFYEDPTALFDVKSGNDGKCSRAQRYLCHAKAGYDGPTGNGTPDGPLQLSD